MVATYLNLEMLGKRIRQGRLKLDLTQYALAEEVGVSQNFLGDIERGIKAPSITTAIRLANVLGVSLDVLFAESLTNTLSESDDMVLTDKQLSLFKKFAKDIKDSFVE